MRLKTADFAVTSTPYFNIRNGPGTRWIPKANGKCPNYAYLGGYFVSLQVALRMVLEEQIPSSNRLKGHNPDISKSHVHDEQFGRRNDSRG